MWLKPIAKRLAHMAKVRHGGDEIRMLTKKPSPRQYRVMPRPSRAQH